MGMEPNKYNTLQPFLNSLFTPGDIKWRAKSGRTEDSEPFDIEGGKGFKLQRYNDVIQGETSNQRNYSHISNTNRARFHESYAQSHPNKVWTKCG